MNRMLIALAATALSAPAFAADFSFVDNTGTYNSITFNIATNPTPYASSETTFDIHGVSTHETGDFGQELIYDDNYTFYTEAFFGGFGSSFLNYTSAQMFGGTTVAPVFYNGVYNLSDFPGGDTVGTLTITNAVNAPGGVPEPASWALMLTGFGAAGVTMRRRAKLATA